MITRKQANMLRGLVARHARCQWNMGATTAPGGDPELRKRIVEDAQQASERLFNFISSIQERTPKSVPTRKVQHLPNFQQISKGKP